jgi:hypothetical protein
LAALAYYLFLSWAYQRAYQSIAKSCDRNFDPLIGTFDFPVRWLEFESEKDWQGQSPIPYVS